MKFQAGFWVSVSRVQFVAGTRLGNKFGNCQHTHDIVCNVKGIT